MRTPERSHPLCAGGRKCRLRPLRVVSNRVTVVSVSERPRCPISCRSCGGPWRPFSVVTNVRRSKSRRTTHSTVRRSQQTSLNTTPFTREARLASRPPPPDPRDPAPAQGARGGSGVARQGGPPRSVAGGRETRGTRPGRHEVLIEGRYRVIYKNTSVPTVGSEVSVGVLSFRLNLFRNEVVGPVVFL